MSEQTINQFMGVSLEKIRSLVDSNTIIGDPITCGNETTVIPVSKISVGFASGGSDLPTRTQKNYFAGGAGGGEDGLCDFLDPGRNSRKRKSAGRGDAFGRGPYLYGPTGIL